MTPPLGYQHTLAKIERTYLGYEDHGIFSLTVMFSYGASGQGFGAIALGCGGQSIAGDLIEAVLKGAGVDRWEALPGRTVYAIRELGFGGAIRGIAPLPTEAGTGFVLESGRVIPYVLPEGYPGRPPR